MRKAFSGVSLPGNHDLIVAVGHLTALEMDVRSLIFE